MSRVIAESKGSDRLIGRQAQLAPVCAAKGLFSNEDGSPSECGSELGQLDPYHAWGVPLTLCNKCIPKVEEDLLGLEEDRRILGHPESSGNTSGHGGLEEAYTKKHIEKNIKGPSKKEHAMVNVTDMLKALESGPKT